MRLVSRRPEDEGENVRLSADIGVLKERLGTTRLTSAGRSHSPAK
jgi:hypothetical protein